MSGAGPTGGAWRGGHAGVLRTGKLLEIPFAKATPGILAIIGASIALVWFDTTFITKLPEGIQYEGEGRPVAERAFAPPVFRNPIYHKIPGYILGPEDMDKA